MGLKDSIDQSISNEAFYGKFFEDLSKKNQLCPFHEEKTPSFFVDVESGKWYCHGQCGTGGDKYEFWRKKHDCTFADALKGISAAFMSSQIKQRSRRNKTSCKKSLPTIGRY